MGKHSPTATTPRYLTQFQCLGSACPETCCTGWTVTIDKPHYQQYRKVRGEPLATLLHQSLERTPEGGASAHARIRLREDGSCPLLDEQQLCRIQSTLGAQALSNTCSQYPRLYGRDGEQHQMFATLSCPEAARLALTDPAALDPVPVVLPFANAQLVPLSQRRVAPAGDEADPVRKHARLISTAVQSLVRLPQLGAAQSLVQAGLMLRSVARIEERGQAGELALAQTLQHYLAPDNLAAVPALMDGLAVPREAQLAMLFDTTNSYMLQRGAACRPSFKALISDVEDGLQLQQGAAVAVERLQAALHQCWQPLEAAQPQLLKNYLLNDLEKSLFPRQGLAELERDFMHLAVRFALIRFYLLGLAAQRGPDFGVDDVVRVVYVVARNIEHHPKFIQAVLDDLQARDALRLEVLATLVL